jgi:hypothetical protein
MPGFLGGSSGSSGTSGEIRFPAELIDPVTKLRVSQPQTMMDTDFEYGLQPTKWETVELINNTPSFFSASGDTTIPNLLDLTTTTDSREVKVTTSLPHGLAVGIPLNISGSKSLTADGAYIINSVPDSTTFTYLCKQNQLITASIIDLYTSVITGQFFQGSQIKIADSDGIVTNASSVSTLTVKTDSPHGFGVNTPFYFLNLNSTVSQEFDASNTGAKSFDSSNTATAQSFDGSNTLTSYSIDLDNRALTSGVPSSVVSTNISSNTVTVTHGSESFLAKPVGTPLYYNVSAASGHFSTTPRGIVYLASNDLLGASSSEFKVSLTPGGTELDLTVTVTGTFQLANNAVLFAGNNTDSVGQTILPLSESAPGVFDGANNLGTTSTVNSFSNGSSIFQMQNNAGSGTATGLSVGSMIKYSTTGTAAGGLTNNTTYWITYINIVVSVAPGLVQIKVAATPGGSDIVISSQGSGTHSIQQIGVSTDKDIFYIPLHGLTQGDLVKYAYPAGGAVTMTNRSSDYVYVSQVFDANNVSFDLTPGMTATSTGAVTTITPAGESFQVHTFLVDSQLTSKAHSITFNGSGTIDFLLVGGGAGGGGQVGGGGGAGGMVVASSYAITAGTYAISVGGGGVGSRLCCAPYTPEPGDYGKPTTFNGISANGGGGGGGHPSEARPVSGNDGIGGGFGRAGGSGGGGGGDNQSQPRPGGSSNQTTSGAGWVGYGGSGGGGFVGWAGGGGGGAGGNGTTAAGNTSTNQLGGAGRENSFRTGVAQFYAAGGNGGNSDTNVYVGPRTSGIGGRGTGFNSGSWDEKHAVANTGSGGGGTRDGIPAGDGSAGIVVIRFRG